jgi:uncharacterized repeat protein (TIGR03837 family)
MLWDLFCRVVDNFGDIGVCWRAAAELAARGQQVRLWTDDASALDWMAPDGHAGVQVLAWDSAETEPAPGDVVIEAFGCNPPAPFVQRMAERATRPVWINLEYLSAEDYVERSHALLSPQPQGLKKWFFYPGFTPRTGGLLRERDMAERMRRFDRSAWLAQRGVSLRPGERVVSLFCYENRMLSALLGHLAAQPTLLLAAAGSSALQVVAALGPDAARGGLRAIALPHLTQTDYDALLWTSDLNFVRGEDSFVRSQWAGKPFVWQIYPQADGAHASKLHAFLDLFLAGADPAFAAALRACWAAWNGLSASVPALPPPSAWQAQANHWRDGLLAQPDLITELTSFVNERR